MKQAVNNYRPSVYDTLIMTLGIVLLIYILIVKPANEILLKCSYESGLITDLFERKVYIANKKSQS